MHELGLCSSIVDAMGGLTMTFDGPVVDWGRTIVDHAGTQVITGEQALALVRARHVAGDPTADLGRIGRQQQVLPARRSARPRRRPG